MTQKVDKTLKIICDAVSEAGLNRKEILKLMSQFVYSIGVSMEPESNLQSSEAVLKSYIEKPTLGTALMAQALWMRDTWNLEEEETNEQL